MHMYMYTYIYVYIYIFIYAYIYVYVKARLQTQNPCTPLHTLIHVPRTTQGTGVSAFGGVGARSGSKPEALYTHTHPYTPLHTPTHPYTPLHTLAHPEPRAPYPFRLLKQGLRRSRCWRRSRPARLSPRSALQSRLVRCLWGWGS